MAGVKTKYATMDRRSSIGANSNNVVCLAAGGNPVVLPEGTSTVTAASVIVPGGTMGKNGTLRISVRMRFDPAQTGSKVFDITLGGQQLATFSGGGATWGSIHYIAEIQNKDSESLQAGTINAGRPFQENATTTFLSAAVNTAVDQELRIRVRKVNGTDLAVLENWHVECVRPFD
jgi:hypothetical protein